jgi:hypothetical protein
MLRKATNGWVDAERPGRRRSALVAGLVACGLGLSAAASPAASAAAPNSLINPWSLQNEQGGYDVTRAQAVADAQRANLITAHRFAYGGDVPAMTAANPKLLVLAYVNATFAQADEGTKYPEEWYSRDANGAKVQNRSTGNYMMDPGQEGWILDRINECKARISTLGYHGCSLDVLGLAPLSAGFVTAPAINPRTQRPWTKADWVRATANLARRINVALDEHGWPTYGNGLSTGGLYFDRANPTKQLLDAMDGGMAEAWLRGSSTDVTAYKTEDGWKKEIEMVRSGEAAGKPILTLTKMWVTTTTKAQKDAWRKYSLASFLLATGGRSYFYYSDGFGASRTGGHAWYSANIGSLLPVGHPNREYRKVNSVYQRDFTNGRAVVNPSNRTYRVPIGGTFRTIDGRTVTGSVTLKPNAAEILIKS